MTTVTTVANFEEMKMKKKIVVIFLSLAMLFGFGCVAQMPRVHQSKLQIRQSETRTYEISNYKLVMKAVMNSLQDEGFIIKQANVELGLLVATKEQDIENKGESLFLTLLAGSDAVYKKNSIVEASVNISRFGKKTRVRVTFTGKAYNNKGGVMGVSHLGPEVYQTFFSDASKAIFLAKENM